MATCQFCIYPVVGRDICELCYYNGLQPMEKDNIYTKIKNYFSLPDTRLTVVKYTDNLYQVKNSNLIVRMVQPPVSEIILMGVLNANGTLDYPTEDQKIAALSMGIVVNN